MSMGFPAVSQVRLQSVKDSYTRKKKPTPDRWDKGLDDDDDDDDDSSSYSFRLETGVPVRIKPFGVEVRNVKCVRCGNYGHQSGDRECPLRDAIMPNEESRLRRDDPLTAIMAQIDSSEPLNWELKQKPGGMSPPRGGFKPEDPNQQIIPAEDIFDEYGGFLNGDNIPDLLTNLSAKKSRKHSRKTHRDKKSLTIGGDLKVRHRRPSSLFSGSGDNEKGKSSRKKKKKKKHDKRRCHDSNSSTSESSDSDRYRKRRKRRQHRSEHSTSGSD